MPTPLPPITDADAAEPVDVWGISALELGELIALCAPSFAGRARIQIIDDHFEGAAEKIRQRMQHAHCDVLVSAGANADYLRATFNLPVATVRVGGYDVMHALTKARHFSGRMALLLHRAVPAEIEAFLATFGVELDVRAYETNNDARNVVQKLAKKGVRVVIGAGLAVRVAREHGMAGVFLYSAASVTQAIEDAVQGVNARRREAAQQRTLASVLSHLEVGVIAVDHHGRITAANRAADTLTGRSLGIAAGRLLRDVVPSLDPASLFASGESRRSAIHRFDQHSVAVDAVMLFDAGRPSGVAYTLHAATAVASAFRKLRAHDKARVPATRYTLAQIVQASPQMQAVVRRCETVAARSEAAVLIRGPSGVGKELLAQGIHHASRRRSQAFVAVNCGALTDTLIESEFFGYEDGAFTGARRTGKAGLFEAAHRGTLFLDEIAELPLLMQTRLLRVLQEHEVTRVGAVQPTAVDVRIIAATHGDLAAKVRDGSFRKDLYYRLAVLRIDVPPLRDRPEDIDALARLYVGTAMRNAGVESYLPPVLDVLGDGLAGHTWPGNVREVDNVAQRIAMACAEFDRPISAAEMHALLDTEVSDPSPPVPLAASTREQVRRHVHAVVAACGGNQAEAARRLGISRSTLWRKLQPDINPASAPDINPASPPDISPALHSPPE